MKTTTKTIYVPVKCSEEMPDDARDVCGFDGERIHVCCYDGGGWYTEEEGSRTDIDTWLKPITMPDDLANLVYQLDKSSTKSAKSDTPKGGVEDRQNTELLKLKLDWQTHNRDNGLSWNEVSQLVDEVVDCIRGPGQDQVGTKMGAEEWISAMGYRVVYPVICKPMADGTLKTISFKTFMSEYVNYLNE